MSTVHTAHGPGTIVASETTRGRTHYKVAGRGFEIWMDETEVNLRTAAEGGENLFSYAPEMEAYARAEHHIPGLPEHSPEGHGYYGDVVGSQHEAFGSGAFAHEPPGPIIEDNEADLPYNPFDGQYPVDMFRHEQTQSNDHELDPKKRLRPTKSRSGDPAPQRPYPGPNPDLFAKSAGMGPSHHGTEADWEDAYPDRDPSENPNHPDYDIDYVPMRDRHHGNRGRMAHRYIQVEAEVDHFNDPVQRFRDDPVGEMRRMSARDLDRPEKIGRHEGIEVTASDGGVILVEGAWKDVRAKAMRLRREGNVDVKDLSYDRIYASVRGDSGTYETMIAKGGDYGQVGQGISNWRCSCKWGKWAFKRQRTFVGRLCSHAYAAYMTMQSRHVKDNPDHPFHQRRRKSAAVSVDDFKKWIDDENGGHIDMDAADRYVATAGDSDEEDSDLPVNKEDAQKIYDYAMGHVSERPERDYEQDGYSLDNEDHYKTSARRDPNYGRYADLLRMQPHKMSPDMIVVPRHEGEDAHYFTDLGDDRETTGPDQIMASRWLISAGDGLGPKGGKGHHPAFAWHDDEEPDFPDQGIVHFSSRRLALTYTADEDLLSELRNLSDEAVEGDPGHQKDRNEKVREVVDELHERGYDASQFVAALRTAAPGDPDDDQKPGMNPFAGPYGGGSGGPGAGGPAPFPFAVAPPAQGGGVGGGDAAPFPQNPGGLSTNDPHYNPQAPVPGVPGQSHYDPNSPASPGEPNTQGGFTRDQVPANGFPPKAPPAAPPGKGGGSMDYKSIYPPSGPNAGAGAGGAGGPSGTDAWTGGHTVGQGENLTEISKMPGMGGDVSALEKGNAAPMASGTDIGKNPDLIHPGDFIKSPGAGGAGSVSGIGPAGTPMKDPAGALAGGGASPTPKAGPAVSLGTGLGGGGGSAAPAPANAPGETTGQPSGGAAGPFAGPYTAPVSKSPALNSMFPTSPGGGGLGGTHASRWHTAAPGDPAGVVQPAPPTAQPAAQPAAPAAANIQPVAPPAANAAAGLASASAAMKTPIVQPPSGTASGIHANAQRFAERYFMADENGAGGDDPSNYRSTTPTTGVAPGAAPGPTATPKPPSSEMPNGAGTPAGPSGMWTQGPHGPVDTSGQAGANQVNQNKQNTEGPGQPATQGQEKQKSPFGGGGGGGMGGAEGIGNFMNEIGPAISGVSSALPGLMNAVGPALSGLSGLAGGLGHIFGNTDAERFAARYFEADGSFLGEGGPDQADYPFAGSGPDRQDWATTSEAYIDEHEKGNRDETWHTDSDGDIIKYTSPPRQRPKQAGVDESQLSASAREFWADAQPGDTGYFNPHNRPYQEDDSSQYKPDPKGAPEGKPGEGDGGGMYGDALEGGEAAGELGEVAPLLLAAVEDDGSDIVRQFQASAGAQALMGSGGNKGGGSGRFDDFAGAADRFLKTAGRDFTLAEQRALEDEEHHLGARNLSGLDLAGTHYE